MVHGPEDRLLLADFFEGFFSTLLVEIPEVTEAVQGIPYDLAGLRDISEFLGQEKQAKFVRDELVLSIPRHPSLGAIGLAPVATAAGLRPPAMTTGHPIP